MTPSHRLTSPLNLLPGLVALCNHPAGVLPPLRCLAASAVFLPLRLSRCASPTRGDRIARTARQLVSRFGTHGVRARVARYRAAASAAASWHERVEGPPTRNVSRSSVDPLN